MKRKIVQHGPCTLTVSLPAEWVREFALHKGDEIAIEPMRNGLFIYAEKERHHGSKRINLKGMHPIAIKALCALYKKGYDEIIVEYGNLEELELIHQTVSTGFIGFEIIDETKEEIVIKKVSEPTQEEFKTIFRRIFRFIISTAEEGAEAAERHDRTAYQKLIYRDENINKLTDFCRRIVNKKGQGDYEQDTALYHVIEQLEKIGDGYKEINATLLQRKQRMPKQSIESYKLVNKLLREYEDLFFNFTLAKVAAFHTRCKQTIETVRAGDDAQLANMFENVARELYNLSGATMILHL